MQAEGASPSPSKGGENEVGEPPPTPPKEGSVSLRGPDDRRCIVNDEFNSVRYELDFVAIDNQYITPCRPIWAIWSSNMTHLAR